MLLKIKAKIYQYTKIYLAQKEEDAYIASAKADIDAEMSKLPMDEQIGNADYNYEFISGSYIGMWQAEHGFCAVGDTFSKQAMLARFKKQYVKRAFYGILNFVSRVYTQAKWDIKGLVG